MWHCRRQRTMSLMGCCCFLPAALLLALCLSFPPPCLGFQIPSSSGSRTIASSSPSSWSTYPQNHPQNPHTQQHPISSPTPYRRTTSGRREDRFRPLFYDVNGVGGMIIQSQLFNAMVTMNYYDKYNSVLTGLCTKIMMNENESDNKDIATTTLKECESLLQEMNAEQVAISPESFRYLVDCTVRSQNAATTSTIMSLCLHNSESLMTQYGAQQADILLFPLNRSTTNRLSSSSSSTSASLNGGGNLVAIEGSSGERHALLQRLETLPRLPSKDDKTRQQQIATALTTAWVGLACVSTNFVYFLQTYRGLANTLQLLTVLVFVVDNFYESVQMGAQNVVQAASRQPAAYFLSPKQQEVPTVLPPVESLPWKLGTGHWTNHVVQGWSLCMSSHPTPLARAQCQAAALYTGYVLGLPCFAILHPNRLEATVYTLQHQQRKTIPQDLDATMIQKMLIWLLAPVAMEFSHHSQLVLSDPREAEGYLDLLEDYFTSRQKEDDVDFYWLEDEQPDLFWLENKEELIQWAYAEALNLVQGSNNKVGVTSVTNRLLVGAGTSSHTTTGDCVAAIENWK